MTKKITKLHLVKFGWNAPWQEVEEDTVEIEMEEEELKKAFDFLGIEIHEEKCQNGTLCFARQRNWDNDMDEWEWWK